MKKETESKNQVNDVFLQYRLVTIIIVIKFGIKYNLNT